MSRRKKVVGAKRSRYSTIRVDVRTWPFDVLGGGGLRRYLESGHIEAGKEGNDERAES